jgi:hypothetical protein
MVAGQKRTHKNQIWRPRRTSVLRFEHHRGDKGEKAGYHGGVASVAPTGATALGL